MHSLRISCPLMAAKCDDGMIFLLAYEYQNGKRVAQSIVKIRLISLSFCYQEAYIFLCHTTFSTVQSQ